VISFRTAFVNSRANGGLESLDAVAAVFSYRVIRRVRDRHGWTSTELRY
jgi:hypothetical protein